jgi:hypothetical protein
MFELGRYLELNTSSITQLKIDPMKMISILSRISAALFLMFAFSACGGNEPTTEETQSEIFALTAQAQASKACYVDLSSYGASAETPVFMAYKHVVSLSPTSAVAALAQGKIDELMKHLDAKRARDRAVVSALAH